MKLPPSFAKNEYHALLKHCLYKLKQNGREWYTCIHHKLVSMDFLVSSFDPCVFIKKNTDVFFIFLYINDLLFFSKSSPLMQHVKNQINCNFSCKDLSKTKYILSFEVNYGKDSITLSQRAYTQRILQRFSMDDCRATKTPLPPNTFLPRSTAEDIINQNNYQKRVGSLSYLAISTRPDIAHAVNQLGQYSSCPTNEHHRLINHNLRYLSSTQSYGVSFPYSHLSLREAALPLHVYTDASFAPDPDTRRSISSFIHLLSNALISWSAKLQRTVAVSTCEAEYMAASIAVAHLTWLKAALGELKVAVSTTLFVNNKSSIDLIYNHRLTERSKHIDVHYHHIREHYNNGAFNLQYIRTNDNLADAFTKPLKTVAFCRLIDAFMNTRPNEAMV